MNAARQWPYKARSLLLFVTALALVAGTGAVVSWMIYRSTSAKDASAVLLHRMEIDVPEHLTPVNSRGETEEDVAGKDYSGLPDFSSMDRVGRELEAKENRRELGIDRSIPDWARGSEAVELRGRRVQQESGEALELEYFNGSDYLLRRISVLVRVASSGEDFVEPRRYIVTLDAEPGTAGKCSAPLYAGGERGDVQWWVHNMYGVPRY